MTKTSSRLGRGLGSLISAGTQSVQESAVAVPQKPPVSTQLSSPSEKVTKRNSAQDNTSDNTSDNSQLLEIGTNQIVPNLISQEKRSTLIQLRNWRKY